MYCFNMGCKEWEDTRSTKPAEYRNPGPPENERAHSVAVSVCSSQVDRSALRRFWRSGGTKGAGAGADVDVNKLSNCGAKPEWQTS